MDSLQKRPSLNSAMDHKSRMARAELIAKGLDPDQEGHRLRDELLEIEKQEAVLTETEQRIIDEAKAMSLQNHLMELRRRIIICIISVVVGAILSYYFAEEIIGLLTAPAGKLYYMRPTEAFFTYMKVALFSGFVIASPIVLYQIWAFVMPALTKGERKISNWLVPVAVLLFLSGILFSYVAVLPAATKFFIGFGTEDLQPLFSVSQYIEFVISFILPFGVVFELPLVVVVLAKINLITSDMLKKYRKYFIFLSFVIGGVISPTPDMFSQTMIALPMILLYECSLFITKYMMKK